MADMNKGIVRTGGNGRRSACVAYGGLVYVSGITTVDLAADTAGQARDVMAQIEKLLLANGSHKNRLLSVNVTLRDMADYGHFNAVWDEWVVDAYEPARNVTGGELALPEYRIKISGIAAQL